MATEAAAQTDALKRADAEAMGLVCVVLDNKDLTLVSATIEVKEWLCWAAVGVGATFLILSLRRVDTSAHASRMRRRLIQR